MASTIPSSTTAAPTGISYLVDKIPAEIRLQIYDSLWSDHDFDVRIISKTGKLCWAPVIYSNEPYVPKIGILSACKTTHREALPIYYNKACFTFTISAIVPEAHIADVEIITEFGAFQHMRDLFLSVSICKAEFLVSDEPSKLDLSIIKAIVVQVCKAKQLQKLEIHVDIWHGSRSEIYDVIEAVRKVRSGASIQCSIRHPFKPSDGNWAIVEDYRKMVAEIGGYVDRA